MLDIKTVIERGNSEHDRMVHDLLAIVAELKKKVSDQERTIRDQSRKIAKRDEQLAAMMAREAASAFDPRGLKI